ncbi:MAG: hypothetical protein LOD94_03795 [Gammaproteobacteria bacterium]|nr:hypothetical protein [Gammaproteobacteria bacterium]
MSPNTHPEPLEQIFELNRLFLRFLQSRNLDEARRMGLPASAADPLKAATPEQLDAAAEFPRGLFQLQLTDANDASPMSYESFPLPARILEMTIAYCAWSTSRDSVYHARLFFGLGAEVIHTLRTTPLSELPRLAMCHARVVCAFQEAEWLWRELLVETRPEARRQLVLVALQPPLPSGRAFRRPAERIRGGRT